MSEIKEPVEQIDDKPQVVKADLRKFNRAEAKVNTALAQLATINVIEKPDQLTSAMQIMKDANLVQKMIEAKRLELTKPFRDATDKINDYAKKLIEKLPPAITLGKNAVIAYQNRQAQRLKDERTTARHAYVLAFGFTHYPDGNSLIQGNIYIDQYDLTIPRFSLENLENDAWQLLLTRNHDARELKNQEKLKALQASAEVADFFGDTDAVQLVQEEIQDAKATAAVVPMHIPSFGGGSFKAKGTTKTWTFDITDASQVPREYLMVDETKIRNAVRDGVRTIPGVNIFQKDGVSLR